MIETDDYVSMMMNGTAWYNRPGPWPVMKLELNPRPQISGKIHSRGGLYAYPQHRKRGLAYAATRLMRSISLMDNIAWTVSQTSRAGVSKNLPIDVFGYTYCELAFTNARIPFAGKPVDVYFVTVSGAEMAAQLSGDIDWLRMRCNQDLSNIAAAWRGAQRHDQAVEPTRLTTVA
ncbi:MAG: hypothetical protein EXQ92_14410 [Alphaproteobacteria bacterium]|nr:hypothetical protein [Alphaproteobacteria bacterium]